MDSSDIKPKTTPKDFFLWAGAMVSLYGGVVAFITLLFQYINYAYPDVLANTYYYDPYNGSIRFAMSALIVLTPLFLVLMRLIRRDIEKDPSRAEIWVRRWALYLTLFVAGATMAGDLITLVNYFLDGDITTRFVLKVLVVFLVAGAGFLHFLADLRGYWIANSTRANLIGYATLVLVVGAIVSGFFIIGTPMQARLYRFDEQKVNHLMDLQSNIVYHWQQKGALPKSLTDLNNPISGYSVPTDLQTGKGYEYRATGPLTFELCATFNRENHDLAGSPYSPLLGAEETWAHGEGRTCFERAIDPDRNPPINKPRY